MKNPLHQLSFRLTILAFLVIIIPVGITLGIAGNQLKNEFKQAILDDLMMRLDIKKDRSLSLLNIAVSEVEVSASHFENEIRGNSPPPPEFSAPGFYKSEMYHDWVRDLSNVLRKSKHYLQARIILSNGQELIRFNRTDSGVEQVPLEKLQNKAHRDYFKHVIGMPEGATHIHPITLNREHGKISLPQTPMLRICKQIILEDGKPFGIVVLNMATEMIFGSLSFTKDARFLIIDEEGTYLHHRDKEILFGKDLGHDTNLLKEEPELKINLQKQDFRIHYDPELKEYRVWRKVFFDQSNLLKYWVFMELNSETSIVSPWFSVAKKGMANILVVLTIGFLLFMLAAQRTFRPLEKLKNAIDKIKEGNFKTRTFVKSNTEISAISGAFDSMAEKLEKKDLELRRSMALAQSISDIAPNAHILINRKGIIMSVNPATVKIFGYRTEELVGQNVKAFMPSPHRELHDQYIQNYLKTGIAKAIGHRMEIEAIRKGGQKFPLSIYVGEAKIEEERIFVGIVEDITEQKQAEKELKEKNNLIQLMLEITVAASEESTVNGVMFSCLSKICKYAGWQVGHVYEAVYSTNSLPVLKSTGLWHISDPSRFETFRKVTETTNFAPGEGLPGRVFTKKRPAWITDATKDLNFPRAERAKAQNNDIGIRSAFAFPLLEGDKVVAVLEFFSEKTEKRDEIFMGIVANFSIQLGRVTERKRAEEEYKKLLKKLKKVNEEIKTFANIVSHDLRSPLVNLKGFSQELKSACEDIKEILKEVSSHLTDDQQKKIEGLLQEDIPEALGFIDSSTSSMDRMVSSILTLARIGSRELHFVEINTSKLVGEKIKILHHQIESKGIKVKLNGLPVITADMSALDQIFSNILSNAINYLDPDRPGVIEISGKQREKDTLFSVKDYGRGIAEEDRHKVFELFRRAGKPVVPGEGMGLAYVKALVERHGGEIWFESQEGKETTFYFTIPVMD